MDSIFDFQVRPVIIVANADNAMFISNREQPGVRVCVCVSNINNVHSHLKFNGGSFSFLVCATLFRSAGVALVLPSSKNVEQPVERSGSAELALPERREAS